MDLQATAQLLGNLGEFIGSIAILVTLIYLAVQIRQSRDQQISATRQQREESLRDQQMRLAGDGELTGVLCKARDAFGDEIRPFVRGLVERGLTRVEAERVFSYFVAVARIQASTFYATIDNAQQQQSDAVTRRVFKSGVGAFWQCYAESLSEGLGPFKSHVDRLLS